MEQQLQTGGVTVQEIRVKSKDLENMINRLLYNFQEQTGMTPDIELLKIPAYADKRTETRVSIRVIL